MHMNDKLLSQRSFSHHRLLMYTKNGNFLLGSVKIVSDDFAVQQILKGF